MNTADNNVVQALVEILASLASIDDEHRFEVFNEVNAFNRAVSDEIRELILKKIEETQGE